MVAGQATGPRTIDTRTRILLAAVGLFAERGYAGTSVRDISERLGVTKAALYYHFPSKETILDALLDPFISEFNLLVERARRSPALPPRELLERMVAVLAGSGGVLCVFANDPSVLHRRIGKDDMIAQSNVLVRALAGPNPTPTRLIRARCAVGCVQSGIFATAFERISHAPGSDAAPADEAGCRFGAVRESGRGDASCCPEAFGSSWLAPVLSEGLRHEIVEAAVAALGSDPPTP